VIWQSLYTEETFLGNRIKENDKRKQKSYERNGPACIIEHEQAITEPNLQTLRKLMWFKT